MAIDAPIPLSVLDLAPVTDGSDAATAVRRSVELARYAERFGYRRFWLAEHHAVAVASSSTPVLIALIAGATTGIRVGSAAVQSGLHTPLSIVEAFGTVDALHPGRLDLGLGRSAQRRAELQQNPQALAGGEDVIVDGLLIPPQFPIGDLLASPRVRAAFGATLFDGATPPDFTDAVDDVLSLLAGRFRH